jgi:hypothetical protein
MSRVKVTRMYLYGSLGTKWVGEASAGAPFPNSDLLVAPVPGKVLHTLGSGMVTMSFRA